MFEMVTREIVGSLSMEMLRTLKAGTVAVMESLVTESLPGMLRAQGLGLAESRRSPCMSQQH